MHRPIAIGEGPGGCAAALRAVQGGPPVTFFESRQVGGTCLNRGYVPTKAPLHGAGPGCNWSAPAAEMKRVASTLRASQEKQFRAAGMEFIPYRVMIIDPHMMEAGGAAYETVHTLVAAGSRPVLPSIPGLDTLGVVTNDDSLSDLRPPDRLVITDGGVIGVELACVWTAIGARVTILKAAPRLLPTLERELGQSLATWLRQDGVEVFARAGVTGVAPGLTVALTHRGEAYRLEADAVLVATGWQPVTDGLPTGGLLSELERGFFRVDEQFYTSTPFLYATGDAIGGTMLAHKAEAEGRFVADLLLGRILLHRVVPIPICAYTSLELVQVGLITDEARVRGILCAVDKCVLRDNACTFVKEGKRDFVKLVLHRESRALLGTQLYCYRVTDLISELALAVTLELTAEQPFRPVRPHPTLGETISEAVETAFLLSQPSFSTKRRPPPVDASFLSTLTPSNLTILTAFSPSSRSRWQKFSLWVA